MMWVMAVLSETVAKVPAFQRHAGLHYGLIQITWKDYGRTISGN